MPYAIIWKQLLSQFYHILAEQSQERGTASTRSLEYPDFKEIFTKFRRFQLVRDKPAQGDSKLKQIHIVIDIWELREVVPMARIC